MNSNHLLPANELDRLLNLSEYNIDFSNIENNFADLTKLAASIADTPISLVNLIDRYTQWSVSSYGLEIQQIPRTESACQYTILNNGVLEVSDLSTDERFKELQYVKGGLSLKYYFGVPLTTSEGFNIGALCVMDTTAKQLSEQKIEHLNIIASEIVSRLRALKMIERLKADLKKSAFAQKKIVRDVSEPIEGIIKLTDVMLHQGFESEMEEVLEYTSMIKNNAELVIELVNDVPVANSQQDMAATESFNLAIFREKLLQLYLPPALNKDIHLEVLTSKHTELIPISKFNLLQIAGLLISNAIQYTPLGGSVVVDLKLDKGQFVNLLHIRLTDNGIGLTEAQISTIKERAKDENERSFYEDGFGLGLITVKKLVDSMFGEFNLSSVPREGLTAEVTLAQF